MEAKTLFNQVNAYFGFKIPLVSFDIFQQVLSEFKHENIVCGFGVLDHKQTHLYDMTGVMVQAAILLKKKTYVYDEETQEWYIARFYRNKKGKTWHRFVRNQPPTQVFTSLYQARQIKPSTLAYIQQNSQEQEKRIYYRR